MILNRSSAQQPEILIMVSPPATGKSTLSKRLELEGYHRVNQDTLKTVHKCLASAKSHLIACKNLAATVHSDYVSTHWRGVVVDNTNTDENIRKLWISLARELGLQIRAVCLDVTVEIASSLEKLRMLDPAVPLHEKHHIPGVSTVISFDRVITLIVRSCSVCYPKIL
jgi:predicted kinase